VGIVSAEEQLRNLETSIEQELGSVPQSMSHAAQVIQRLANLPSRGTRRSTCGA
jgi:hypothetical protein